MDEWDDDAMHTLKTGIYDDGGGLSVIDAHFHIWDPAEQRLDWLGGDASGDAAGGLAALNRRWTMRDLETCYRPFAAQGVHWLGGVYVEVDCDDPIAEDRLVYGNRDPHILADVMRSAVSPWMRVPLFAAGVRDPLHVPSSPRGRCLEPTFVAGLRALGAAGLPFDACVRVDELDDLAAAHEQTPGLTLVIDHMGNVTPDTFDERYMAAMRRLAASPNTVVKVSGYPTADRAFVRDLLAFSRETFAGRRMYASNWPVVSMYSTFDEHLQLLLDEDGGDESLFRDVAARVYGIDVRGARGSGRRNADGGRPSQADEPGEPAELGSPAH
ncbi:amidohydrolase [Bifidobacterium leontopitheci]|uniref:Amidohydrolase n=1 Tax=Bifidobacterium leontopitheci TaxID=2650774 RepID=A0A6I1GNE5_9BIFI|nr:amidohydrolase [Bifidobacterium leontopitheci]